MGPQTGDSEKNGFIPNEVCNGREETPCLAGPAEDHGIKVKTLDDPTNNGNIDTETGLKSKQQDEESHSTKPKVRLRISKTVCLYTCFLGVGLATNILGPTLVNMREFLHTDTESIVTAFSGSIVGWIGGSVVAGFIYERFNPELQLTLASLVMCVTTGVAPWCGSLYGFIALMTIQGLGAGFIDAAGQPYGLRLWDNSKKKDPIMQATQLFLSIGSCVAPLIINPFLIPVDHDKDTNSSIDNELTQSVSVSGSNVSSVYTSLPAGDEMGNTTNSSMLDTDNMLVGYAYVTFSAVIFLGTVLYFIVYLLNGPSLRVKKSSKVQSKEMYYPKNLAFKAYVYVVLFLFFFLLMWISGLGHLVPALVTDGFDWEIHHGSWIAALFWGMLGLGRMVGIPLSTKLSPAQMLIMDTGVAVLALVLMSLVPVAGDVIMWVSVALLGVATATEFASGVLWASKYIKFTGAVAAVCITGMGTGGIAGVEIAGFLFNRDLYMYVVYFSLAATIAHFLLFIAMHISTEAWYNHIKKADTCTCQTEPSVQMRPSSVELKPLKLSDEDHTCSTEA